MRFERDFYQHLVPGREASYLEYAACKKLFTSTRIRASNESKSPNFEALHQTLSAEAAKVERYYLRHFSQIQRAIEASRAWYGIDKEFNIEVSLQRVNLEELRSLSRKFCYLLTKLQEVFQYGHLNRQGFSRILDKIERIDDQHRNVFGAYARMRIPSANQVECLQEIEKLRNFVSALGRICVLDAPDSAMLSLRLRLFQRTSHPFADSIEDLCLAIYEDEASSLQQLFQEIGLESQALEKERQSLLYDLLEYAAMCFSRTCIGFLARYIQSSAPIDLNGTGSIFHRLTESIGLARKPVMDADDHRDNPQSVRHSTASRAQLVSYIVHMLAKNLSPALDTKDCFGRLPLHYASSYGLTTLCSAYLAHMVPNRDASSAQILQPFLSADVDGYTSLQLSVLGGHVETTNILLETLQSATTVDGIDFGDRPRTIIEEALDVALAGLNDPKRSQLAE
ncbi:MAG: hypothetical protein Q9191_007357, partial [Dirinaria sp. TL-2023a]